jgi:carboxyl-terminal processing protease
MGKLKQAGLVCAGLLGGILISLQFSALADKETRSQSACGGVADLC